MPDHGSPSGQRGGVVTAAADRRGHCALGAARAAAAALAPAGGGGGGELAGGSSSSPSTRSDIQGQGQSQPKSSPLDRQTDMPTLRHTDTHSQGNSYPASGWDRRTVRHQTADREQCPREREAATLLCCQRLHIRRCLKGDKMRSGCGGWGGGERGGWGKKLQDPGTVPGTPILTAVSGHVKARPSPPSPKWCFRNFGKWG